MTNPSPPIPYTPFTSFHPNPNSESTSQLRNSQPQDLGSSLSSTLSSLDDLIRRSEQSAQSLLSLLPIQNPNQAAFNGFVSCPFDSRHLMPPNSLFSHFLRCSSSQFPLQSGLLPPLNYPETLEPSEDAVIRTPHSSGSELCFSLDDFYANFGWSYFYRDCYGVVSMSSLDGVSRNFSLPDFLSVECANFPGGRGRESEGLEKGQRKILPSEFWALRAEVEAWNEYPSVYSLRVLFALSRLDVIRECDLAKWIITNSPRYGVVVDTAMRDHMSLLCKLCLKAIRKEALVLMDKRDLVKTSRNMNFSCPVLVQSLIWLASQVSILYGGMGGKVFTLNIIKECILDPSPSLLFFSLENKEAAESTYSEVFPQCLGVNENVNKDFEVQRAPEIGTNKKSNLKVEKSIASGVIFVSRVAAAIAALHERSLVEEKIKGLRFHQPLNNYQRMAEHDYVSQRAIDERRQRPLYRPIIDHDGIPQLRLSNEGTNKARTREELLAEERDYKRRRMSYRGKKSKGSNLEVMRGIIEDFMDEIKQAGGIGCFEKDIVREDVVLSKYPFGSKSTKDTSMLRDYHHNSYAASTDSPNHRKKQSHSDYGNHSKTSKDRFDKDYYQPRRDSHEFAVDEKSAGRQKRDRESLSRNSRDESPKHSSSRTSRYHDSDTSSTASRLTSEYSSKYKYGRQTTRYESYSSVPLSRNKFEDRYDPSESQSTCEDDMSHNRKYADRKIGKEK